MKKTACIDCTVFDGSDTPATVLAYLCQAAYLSIVWIASVAYTRRETLDLALLLGSVVNAGIGKVLKKYVRQERPTAMCEYLGVCESYGMPSTHAQVLAFVFGAHMVLAFSQPRAQRSHFEKIFSTVETLGLLVLSVTVAYARIHLGYHTVEQVVAGWIIGFVFGEAWTFACMKVLGRSEQRLLGRWRLGVLGVQQSMLSRTKANKSL